MAKSDELRRLGDAEWERGNREAGSRYHEQARLAAQEEREHEARKLGSDDVIRSGPHSGKTTRLIYKSAQGGYIVCATREEAYRISQAAAEMKVNIPFPLTFDELLQGQLQGRRCSPLHIDNADALLRYLCTRVGATLGTITLSE